MSLNKKGITQPLLFCLLQWPFAHNRFPETSPISRNITDFPKVNISGFVAYETFRCPPPPCLQYLHPRYGVIV
jgi:hypothetical protein